MCVLDGFITTSTPHNNPLAHTTLSINVTPPHEATPTHGATPTHRATPPHEAMPPHTATPPHKAIPRHGATPTRGDPSPHRATPTNKGSTQSLSDTRRGHRLDTSENSVKHRTPYSPIVTTLFPDEHTGMVVLVLHFLSILIMFICLILYMWCKRN